jgi:predicted nucleotidyltransferase
VGPNRSYDDGIVADVPTAQSPAGSESVVLDLERQLNRSWAHLRAARERSKETREKLASRLLEKRIATADRSVVVSGSLARDEFTQRSDIDWTFLIDGPADPQDFNVAASIRELVQQVQGKAVGREGTFGKMAFSHDLVHQIGGEDDTNSNTTRRILLLLESAPLGDPEVHQRVLTGVLKRYVMEDQKFAERSGEYHVPRFLLNDIARYWRTMAVDFAYKLRDRQGEGRAIRNIKLRMSRKLIFVGGLLSCFSCQLGVLGGGDCTKHDALACVGCLRSMMSSTPLEILAKTVTYLAKGASRQGYDILPVATQAFDAYDAFLGVLSDTTKRTHLENLAASEMESDELFAEARKISHDFRDAIDSIFFDEPVLGKLTRVYGVF